MSEQDEVRRKLEEKLKGKIGAEVSKVEQVKVPEEPLKEKTPEEAAAEAKRIRAEKKARLAQVLTRGILSDKLRSVAKGGTPDGYVGKFVRDRNEDILRYQNLGWGFTYREEAPKGLHDAATGHIRIGDVVLMTIQREDHEILREIQSDRVKSALSKARKEYSSESNKEAQSGGAVPFDESVVFVNKR